MGAEGEILSVDAADESVDSETGDADAILTDSRLDRLLTARPMGGPVVVGTVGIGLFLVTLLNFVREIQAFGIDPSQIVAVLLGGLLSAIVVYGALVLSRDRYTPRQRWIVAATTLSGIAFVYLVMYFTVFVRASIGLRYGATLQLLASAHAGAVAGLLVGGLYVKARRDGEDARRIGKQLQFMHSILRHDVLNSMTVVRARAEHLDGELDDTHQESIDAIHNQAESVIDLSQRARATVNALAANSRVSPEPVDLSTELREEIATVRSTYDDITLVADVPDDIYVLADDMLAAVFGNLLGNAVQHNDADDPWIDVRVRAGSETVAVRIADNGPGIPDEQKEKIFEQGHSSDGGGFGLFFVRTMVNHYGGSVEVTDNEPRGAVFTVELPRTDRPRGTFRGVGV